MKNESWLRTGMRSGYFCLIRSASALRFSVNNKREGLANYDLLIIPMHWVPLGRRVAFGGRQ